MGDSIEIYAPNPNFNATIRLQAASDLFGKAGLFAVCGQNEKQAPTNQIEEKYQDRPKR